MVYSSDGRAKALAFGANQIDERKAYKFKAKRLKVLIFIS